MTSAGGDRSLKRGVLQLSGEMGVCDGCNWRANKPSGVNNLSCRRESEKFISGVVSTSGA